MRVAVISDIHANERALRAVLAEIDANPPDEIWCLGDVVGYGPAPNECCTLVEERCDVVLVGNHDLVALGELGAGGFNDDAAAAARWTSEQLNDRSRAFLSGLEPSVRLHGCELFHASPLDPVWDYVLTAEGAYAALVETTEPVVLVGHSHVALAIGLIDDALRGGLAPDGTRAELNGRWLFNPGSVGQPRDGDPRAAWLDLELGGSAEFHRVEYPIDETQNDIRDAGLPAGLADRLAHGV
jgi:diadenosine tetraphosphatase ApaH/serine/threonine PP2A family protein phosphatase